ncbi:GCN5-related N-acetyltransferase [Phytophthora megakarya]|uniref:GCN5-related N-acetyltransferase n=1 Tax=Phytophthora megakarya TaxID=4795 RepID=A0A225UX47_9STRA|nr:GCN5-related N-acetyltransferase [Phytophthora megakarya]
MTDSNSKNSSHYPTIDVRQYRPDDHATVTKIFVEGLMAFDDNLDFRYLWEERLRKDLTNDFADIEASHMTSGGNFWVAVDGSSKVVGIIGLQRRAQVVGEVRRLFVDPNCQRMGVGKKLMTKLENWAKEHEIETLFLTTNPKKKQAQAFYTALGYTKVDEIVHFWENPQYFQVDKFVKQL